MAQFIDMSKLALLNDASVKMNYVNGVVEFTRMNSMQEFEDAYPSFIGEFGTHRKEFRKKQVHIVVASYHNVGIHEYIRRVRVYIINPDFQIFKIYDSPDALDEEIKPIDMIQEVWKLQCNVYDPRELDSLDDPPKLA